MSVLVGKEHCFANTRLIRVLQRSYFELCCNLQIIIHVVFLFHSYLPLSACQDNSHEDQIGMMLTAFLVNFNYYMHARVPSSVLGHPESVPPIKPQSNLNIDSGINDCRDTCSPCFDFLDSCAIQNSKRSHEVLRNGIDADKQMMTHAMASSEGSLIAWTSHLQRIGETSFAALLIISMMQAFVALHQYRSNPSGQLDYPHGLTCGVEEPKYMPVDLPSPQTQAGLPSRYMKTKGSREYDDAKGRIMKSTTKTKTHAFQQIKSFSDDTDRLFQEQTVGQDIKAYRRVMFKVNRMMFLLLPWIAKRVNYLLVRNSHIFHIFFIISLASVFDFGRGFGRFSIPLRDGVDISSASSSIIENLKQGGDEKEFKVVVIGDSLAIGIGCVESWDIHKNQTDLMYRVEKLSVDGKLNIDDSPVFPRAFSQTLSKRLRRRIRWRSAGVDGGDVNDIRRFCAGVIQEESEKDKPPDIVIILCGINDFKKAVSNPFNSAKSARKFRKNIETLSEEIRRHAPTSSIIFPALPVQLFHKNSIVNILPLSFFLDTIIGYWDSQKKLVADISPSNVTYLGLTAREILQWYDPIDDEDDLRNNLLISSDGVHPNRRCYQKWGASLANKFCDEVLDLEAERDITSVECCQS